MVSIAWNYTTDNRADELKQSVDFREFIAADNVGAGRRSNKAVMYHSPFREDRKRSFAAYADGWKDFGRDESGDIYAYIQRRYNVDFPGALAMVEAYLGNPANIHRAEQVYQNFAKADEHTTADWQQAAQAILAVTQRRLWNTPRILDYLRSGRGFTDETIQVKGYGYNPEWIKTTYIKDDGKAAWLAPGWVIPTYDERGELCGLRVRTITGSFAKWLGIPDHSDRDGEPLAKYLNMAGSRLAGWMRHANKITPGCDVLIVEGEADCDLAEQLLTGVVVVTLGAASNQLTSAQADVLRTAGRVFSALDNDEAGREATNALAAALGDLLTVLHLPAGKDVTDYVVQLGGDLAAWWATQQRFSWCPDGMRNSLRSALLRYFPKTTAPVIEMLNDAARAGLLDLSNFSIPEAKKANVTLGRGCSDKSIERVITGNPDLFSSKLETGISALHISKIDENPGRPSKRYAAVSLSELQRVIVSYAAPRIYEQHHPAESTDAILAQFTAAMLAGETAGEDAGTVAAELSETLKPAYRQQANAEQFATQRARRECARLLRSFEDQTTTPLPDGWKADAYTAAFFHVHPARDEGLSRADIKRTFGVSNGSIKTLTERAGLKPIERYELRIISSAHDLERQVTEARREHDFKAYPKRFVCSTRQGAKITREYEPNDPDMMESFVAERIAAGDSVAIECQLSNTFEVVRETPPERKERQPIETTDAAAEPTPRRTEPKIQLEPPAPERFYGKTYNPAWIKAQLVYALRLLGKLRGFEYITPDGELIPIPDTIAGLIEAVLGRNLSTGDSLIDFARSEFGAVITEWHASQEAV